MKRVYVLNTCDERKSHSSFHLYGIWASSKAGTRRLVNAIIAGIESLQNVVRYAPTLIRERSSLQRTTRYYIKPNIIEPLKNDRRL